MDIPWRRVHDFGNHLRHGYGSIDSSILEEIVERHLEPLSVIAAAERDRLDALNDQPSRPMA